MKKTIRKSLFTLLLGTVLAVPTAFAETDEQAFNRAVMEIKIRKYQTGLSILHNLANKGNMEAQYELAMIYSGTLSDNTFFFPRTLDYKQAVHWAHKAAEQGHRSAQFHLGSWYEKGEVGVKNAAYKSIQQQGQFIRQDYQQAIYWYMKGKYWSSAANLYWNGKGVSQNIPKAIELYEKTSWGALEIAKKYEYGEGGVQNYQEAAKWYIKYAEKVVPGGINSVDQHFFTKLADLYYFGKWGVTQDYKNAKYYFGFACDKNSQYGCRMYNELNKQGY